MSGRCDPRFAAVRDAFEQALAEQESGGGAVSAIVDGRVVADLWGGSRTTSGAPAPWRADTITCIHSATKAVSVTCVLLLADRGLLALDRPVADVWPEFAAAGKQAITVRTLLGGLAGLVYPDAAPAGCWFEHEPMAQAIAQQAPEWPPGTQGAYHSSTFPCLLEELVRRTTSRPLGEVVGTEILRPLALELELEIGVPDADLPRVAEVHAPPTPAMQALAGDPKYLRAWRQMPFEGDVLNSRTCIQSGSAGAGYATARALASFYGALADGRIVSDGMLAQLREQQWADVCGLTDRQLRMALGLFLNSEEMPMGPNPEAFGHHGLGGSLGMADPVAGVAFGYVTNSLDGEERCGRLLDALYACL
ncbi:EstA family serine hydrolase [Conexibacter woesei]|uniref:Beta-lactamase n=1 Tax=Conexibacter woesei (strain DSM 14684 / CCUG 47730 / CIP 108061 / JCM 11494 / NBRC 100937 / ID131577) TaxID=469383 RepID=D3F6Z1_CONWI|nr:EstA family serine hydrolase [Conexibacter woesei]ADB52789.1 beta-lactamase [Conexibacter woesei DSM 14684]